MDRQTKTNIYLFTAITFLYVLNSCVIRIFYIDDLFFLNSYGGKFDQQYVQQMLSFDKKWGFIKYVFIPFGLFLRISLVTYIIYLGLYLVNVDVSIKYLYKVTILGELIFLVFTITRTILIFFHNFTSFEELGRYAPFRFITVETISNYPPWIKIPMLIINPVEILYWFVLSFLISKLLSWNYFKSTLLVIKTYVVGLIVWIIFIVFINTVLLG